MKKRVVKKTKKDIDAKTEIRHLGVLIENVGDDVKLIAEQYGDIKNVLDKHTKVLDEHTEMIGNLMVDMQIIKTDIEFIKNSLKKKIDVEEFTALERRVALLEKRR